MLKARLEAIIRRALQPRVQNWLANSSVGSLFAQLAPLPIWARLILGAFTVTSFLISFPLLVSRLGGFVTSVTGYLHAYWAFLLLILVALALAVQLLSPASSVPKEIREARNAVLNIQQAMVTGRAKGWTASDDTDQSLRRRLFIRSYSVVVEEDLNGPLHRSYVREGLVVAIDEAAKSPLARARRYYRTNGCNFATDYFDSWDRQVLLEYDPNCTGSPNVVSGDALFIWPAVPVLGAYGGR